MNFPELSEPQSGLNLLAEPAEKETVKKKEGREKESKWGQINPSGDIQSISTPEGL